jgi:predicted nuclease with TOPRIM domain
LFQAVKKCREKKKQEYQETLQRVELLRQQNLILEGKIEEQNKTLAQYKAKYGHFFPNENNSNQQIIDFALDNVQFQTTFQS